MRCKGQYAQGGFRLPEGVILGWLGLMGQENNDVLIPVCVARHFACRVKVAGAYLWTTYSGDSDDKIRRF